MNWFGKISGYLWLNFYQKVMTTVFLFLVLLLILIYFGYYLGVSKKHQQILENLNDVRGSISNLEEQNFKYSTFKLYKEDIDRQYQSFLKPISRTALNKSVSESIQGLGLTMLEEQYAPTRFRNGVGVIEVKMRYRGSYQSIKESLYNFSRISMLNQIESLELALESDTVTAIVELKIYSRIDPENV